MMLLTDIPKFDFGTPLHPHNRLVLPAQCAGARRRCGAAPSPQHGPRCAAADDAAGRRFEFDFETARVRPALHPLQARTAFGATALEVSDGVRDRGGVGRAERKHWG